MVDLTITPASVISDAKAQRTSGQAGVAITAGQLLAIDPVTKKYVLCDSNSATPELRQPSGIALHAAAINQPIAVHTKGPITIGATVVGGTDYYASDSPGGICPRADVGATEMVTMIGLAKSATVIDVDFQYSGVTL